jgi:hypothetical protein
MNGPIEKEGKALIVQNEFDKIHTAPVPAV